MKDLMRSLGREPGQTPERLDEKSVRCHECGALFDSISGHWSSPHSDCTYPDLPRYVRRLIYGLVLGDGVLKTPNETPSVDVYSTNRSFLAWLDYIFDWLSTGVNLYRTAEENCEATDNGPGYAVNPDEYSDLYVLRTRAHPYMSHFEDWYQGDGIEIPPADDLDLTRSAVLTWYCGDGSLCWNSTTSGSGSHVTIGMAGSPHRIEDAAEAFDQSDLGIRPRCDQTKIRFLSDDSTEFLRWIGPAPPGFEYKWAGEDRERYDRLKP